MKFLPSQLAFFLSERESRENVRTLLRYMALLTTTIAAYSVIFHGLMLYEGQRHSWITGLYWTLTVMSTLGFGDITFHSDLGRLFSILVLLSGIVMLLIVLPFTFIRSFYAPWLESQLRLRAPRAVPENLKGHVLLCHYDAIARGLIDRLVSLDIPYRLIEPDPAVAAGLHGEGVAVVTGDLDSRATWAAVRAGHSRLVFANSSDAENTKITITVRESYPDLPVVALADDKDSVDVLQLAGASHVLPLKHQLGEHLASRVEVGTPQAHAVGRFEDLIIAEFPVHRTALGGRSLRDTRLRELTGLNVVACWDRGQLRPATPDTVLTPHSVALVVGTEDQIAELDAMFVIYEPNENPVLLIGGGKVGRSVARSLKARGAAVHVIERDAALRSWLEPLADQVIIGDAADREVETKAGIERAPSVVLSTADDATNIFLAVYCRKLNPETRIVSRIDHERNLEAIHRAGADSVLSYSTLGVQSLLSIVQGRETVVLGEGLDLFVELVPDGLAGRTLGQSGIGSQTGLNVIGVRRSDGLVTNPRAETELAAGVELVMFGTGDQRRRFREIFA